MSETLDYLPAIAAADVPENGNVAVTLNGEAILICNAAGDFYAVANLCSHQASPLEGGRIRSCFIFCPLHGARFDLRDGSTKGQLTQTAIKTYPVRLADGTVEVAV
ncbi:MAG: Rieske 2Fe-2S domain-containing protein [Pseudomonadota bacterium]